jgi:aerobic carbon-monoxide dehydrogenase small subunit
MTTRFIVNGEERQSNADGLTPLVDVLREEFALTGAKAVCREGFCGACTILIEGRTAMSCLVPLALADGCTVTTVEGLTDGGPNSVQQAMEEHDAVQCGMCFPGMVITLTAFLRGRPGATRSEIKAGLTGNLCRCTGYERIIDAAMTVSRDSRGLEVAP